MLMLVTCAGILVVDLIAADLPRISPPGEVTYTPRGIEMHIGGHCGNVSVDLRRLGVQEGMVSATGAVGKDIFGDFILELLRNSGVVTHLQRISESGTSKDLILVVKGEDRRFHTDIGANWHLSPEYVLRVLEGEKPRIFYVGGVGLTGRLDDNLADVLRRAREIGSITFIDPVRPYMHGWEFIISSLKYTSIFHCNMDEARKITGFDDPVAAASALRMMGADMAIVSLGENGLVAAVGDSIFEIPAFKVQVVDPTGAGDALCAGIIHGLLNLIGHEPSILDLPRGEVIDVLLEGAAAGASCVTMVGTTTAVTYENVARILRRQGDDLRAKVRIQPLRAEKGRGGL